MAKYRKQPKLLPCQHTFCYPCLESCADSLHRTLKCPECRAEHSIPYDGVKAFQTNYTLTGFLEIHLQATPDSAAEIEEYIHRWLFRRIFRNVLVLYDVKKSLSHSATTAFRGFLNVVRLTPSHAGEQQLPDGAITARNAIGQPEPAADRNGASCGSRGRDRARSLRILWAAGDVFQFARALNAVDKARRARGDRDLPSIPPSARVVEPPMPQAPPRR
ncbi:zinc finger, C3HC4 type [Ancylostoma duodenale]|uniref:Zinc finger, C3HC4 type n=1 Tax=Ancylostoma duodenale TaxID=51022 RepID=A0A0C2GVB1_9BILA|nr:zinc finger, C3HC4 type [Ancylostoma duodenale]